MPEDKNVQRSHSKIISGLIIVTIVLFGPIGLALVAIFRKKWVNNKLVLAGLCAWSLLYCISFISGVKDGVIDYDSDQDSGATISQDKADSTTEDKSIVSEVAIVCAKNKIRNDTTGNWKIATTSDTIVLSNYAVDYYKKCFNSDGEVHAVVNFTLKTTTKFTKVGSWVNVTTYEYVEKEEHDADRLFSGLVLTDKFYDLETGEEIDGE